MSEEGIFGSKVALAGGPLDLFSRAGMAALRPAIVVVWTMTGGDRVALWRGHGALGVAVVGTAAMAACLLFGAMLVEILTAGTEVAAKKWARLAADFAWAGLLFSICVAVNPVG